MARSSASEISVLIQSARVWDALKHPSSGALNLSKSWQVLPVAEHEVYPIVGASGFARLCAAFYRRIPNDDLLGPMYPKDDWEGAEQRLRDFLIYRFGGPATYIEQRGHPRLRLRHAPFAINLAARDRWMELMSAAMQEAELPAEAIATLTQFFEQMTTFLVNRQPS
jgi:hemoglobin